MRHTNAKQWVYKVSGAFLLAALALSFSAKAAPATDELQQQIDEKSREIQNVEEEIRAFRETLIAKEKEAQTLKSAISKIDLSLKKSASDIRLTELRIARTKLEIKELGKAIAGKEDAILRSRGSIAEILSGIAQIDETGVAVMLIRYPSLAAFFSTIHYLLGVEEGVIARLGNLRTLKSELESSRTLAEKKQQESAFLLATLRYQNELRESERQERTRLLADTRNQERRYQTLLKEQEEKRTALEEEIREIEGKIRVTVDPASLPPRQSGVLGFPLPDIFLASCRTPKETKNCVTQFFGLTSFAAAGAYRGAGHNGIDFRASVGTPVLAAESGIIEGVGDTDIGCRGASYGKWILIHHTNNLATLYAHLSGVSVLRGASVSRGDQIGFTGKTGYATGPHLHFGSFAAAAVEIQTIRSRVCGRDMVLPIAAPQSYLNPLDYL